MCYDLTLAFFLHWVFSARMMLKIKTVNLWSCLKFKMWLGMQARLFLQLCLKSQSLLVHLFLWSSLPKVLCMSQGCFKRAGPTPLPRSYSLPHLHVWLQANWISELRPRYQIPNSPGVWSPLVLNLCLWELFSLFSPSITCHMFLDFASDPAVLCSLNGPFNSFSPPL